jgi:hypothetical protein
VGGGGDNGGRKNKKKRENGKGKSKRIKEKENRRVQNKKENMKGITDISPSYPHYTVRRSCFSKRFPKRIQLPDKIRSTSTATAGAATAGAGAGAQPNTPLRLLPESCLPLNG